MSEIHFRSSFAFWTLGVISVILSVLADAGNLINLFVLTRRHMRSTMTTLLVTLAWADLVPPTVVSLNNILFYYYLPRMSHSSSFLTTHIISRAVFNILANIFTTFSNWLIVLITTFRLIVVKVKANPFTETIGNLISSFVIYKNRNYTSLSNFSWIK
jgi:hypothetical protein